MTNEWGLVQNHAYTVLGVQVTAGRRMVKMRNPWGAETYEGEFSDKDTRWSDALLDEADH